MLEQAAMRAGRVISRIPEGSYSFQIILMTIWFLTFRSAWLLRQTSREGRSHWTFRL
ncbi:hypothetical protein PO124_23885 [Bacillus licheniformis]|nr:hypothetical protein [Bacillus licheniformis]